MTESLTLVEKNRIYQQRYRAKLRERLGEEIYKEAVNDYMKKYREERHEKEGYVRPKPVNTYCKTS
jgi:hypothetical protein